VNRITAHNFSPFIPGFPRQGESGSLVNKKHALIIGGSLGGLFAATLLRMIGWDVDVYERVEDDLAARGAGIATHDEMFDTMRRLGIVIDDTIGIKVSDRVFYDSNGKVIATLKVNRYMSSWVRFYRPMKDMLPKQNYHFGMNFTHYEQTGEGVTACFTDGTRASGDLLIGADGIWSAVRSQCLPEVKPEYAGYIAWRGMVEESEFPPALREEIVPIHTFCLPEGQYMLTYPVPGQDDDTRSGHRRTNFVWYHPVTEEKLKDLCTDSSGKCHGVAIPPQLIRAEVLDEMRAFSRSVFAPQIADTVDLVKQPFFQAIFDCAVPTIVHGRVALLGDAAFVGRPHSGMGTTKAALDAQYLIDALLAASGDLDCALADYNQSRGVFGSRVVARGRWLGAHMSAHLTKPKKLRTPEELEHRSPDVTMREFGAKLADISDLAPIAKRR
jgi:2-polyprenyl-6-methoxyphenol hydroxylase-like FAD-dependent oxidoreductase